MRKEGLGYKEINKITAEENKIYGNTTNNLISAQEDAFIYDLINKRIGYKKSFDIHDINSIINAITYQKTAVEAAKEEVERELGISYEEFDKLDCDEQHKLLQSRKTNIRKDEKIMIDNETILEAGLTLDESRQRLDDKTDDILYSKPVALVKKIIRKTYHF